MVQIPRFTLSFVLDFFGFKRLYSSRKKLRVKVGISPRYSGGQHRQRLLVTRSSLLCCNAHVVKERGNVSIAAIYLIPQHRKPALLQIARCKRGLAAACWRAYPDNRVVFPDAVKEMKQSFAGKDACRTRGSKFWGQRCRCSA